MNGFGAAVRQAEFTKLRTLPATWLALLGASTANILLGILATTDTVRVAGADGPVPIGQFGTLMVLPVYGFVAVAVLAAGTEYRGGQLRVSLLAVPDRHRLFTAKLVVTVAVALLAAIPAVLPGHLIRHATAIAAGAPGIADAVGEFLALVAAYLLLSLIGYGLAISTRSVVIPMGVLVILPLLVSPVLQGAVPAAVRLLPHEATLSFLDLANLADPAVLGRVGGAVTLTTWAALSLGAAWLTLTRRDTS